MKRLFSVIFLLVCAVCVHAQDLRKDSILIDVPTAETLDHYSLDFNTRFFSQNSVMTSVDFGVYPRLNIGFSIAAQELIGNETPIKVLTPQLQAKFKIYDGSLYLPAIAIGYDGREYFYDRHIKEYAHEKKGGYLVLSREIIIPNLQVHPGINFSDFDSSDIFFFTGVNFNIEDKVNVLFEWDNVHNIKDSRLNAGLRIYLLASLDLDFAFRDMAHKDTFERIVQLRWKANF
ncbi:hypothetical protein Emin_0300 [Elusimicrobium minutum Pei191]|uniref:Uncharacterized protein n=1 Tax=Elusimicrobium minutum (strain Pei191) TaxID=445932 RepID=B2KBV6_ELUMP|nr:hypothetical protein [Elusimicrobium minutum]ACC97860.1 hypothetical protein Emin_0300 [Elusimicrobium minutum Pei191]